MSTTITKSHSTSTVLARTPMVIVTPADVPTQLAVANTVDPTLISYWRLDETGTGAAAVDAGSAKLNATDAVGTSTSAGCAPKITFTDPFGRAFPSTSPTYLTTAANTNHAFTSNFTVALWIYPNGGVASQTLVSHMPSALTHGWGLFTSGTGNLVFYMPSGGAARAVTATDLTLTMAWTHIAVVVTGTTVYLYLNGVRSSVTSATLPIAGAAIATVINRVYSDAGNGSNNTLDDVRIYNKALNDPQILTLASGQDPYITTATYVGRDATRNGQWIGVYGTQGYSLLGCGGTADVMAPQQSIGFGGTGLTLLNPWVAPTVGGDVRYLQIPGQGTNYTGISGYYTNTTGGFGCNLDSNVPYKVSLYFVDPDRQGRQCNVNVYDWNGNLLDGPRASGDCGTTGVYLTWTVQGRVQFNWTLTAGPNTALCGWFVDQPALPISWWKLDETGTGTAAVDSGLAAVNGSDFSSSTTVSTAAPTHFVSNPGARHFPGNTYLTVPITAKHAVSDNFTAMAWIRPANVTTHDAIISRLGSAGGSGWALYVTQTNGIAVLQCLNGSTWTTCASNGAVPLNAWTHVTGIMRNGVRRIYINGRPQTQTDAAAIPAAIANVNTIIGAWSFDNLIYQWPGDLDDVRLYTVALTDDQILTLGTGGDLASTVTTRRTHSTDTYIAGKPISYWKLDETATGAVAVDSGPVGANATDPLASTSASTPAPTKFTNPQGRHIPGTFLNAGAHTQHAVSSNFTLGAWIRPTANSTYYSILTRLISSPAAGWVFMLHGQAPYVSYPYFAVWNGSNAGTLLANGPVTLNTWTHVAVVDRAGTRFIYVNGSKQTASDNFAWPLPAATAQTIISGYASDSANTYPFVGDLDDIRFYGNALTDDQIQSLGYGNEPYLVTPSTRTHNTDSMVSKPAFKTHNTDTLLRATSTKTHNTDTMLKGSPTRTHNTSTVVIGSMLSWWKLNETGTGQIAIDSAPLAANATDANGNTTVSTSAPTKFANSGARHFPGTNGTDVLTPGIVAAHALNNNFTVAAWVRPTSFANYMGVVSRLDSRTLAAGGAVGGGWALITNITSGTVAFQTSDGTNFGSPAIGPGIPLNTWTHLTAIVRTGTVAVYYNGFQTGSTGVLPIVSLAMPTNIGNYPSQGTGFPWTGDLDDVRFYGVPLTDDQIQSLGYGNEPFQVTPTTRIHSTNTLLRATSTQSHTTSTVAVGYLVSWWKLDETGTGTTAIDSAPLAAHAADPVGTTTPTTTVPITAPLNFTNPHARFFSGPSPVGPYLDAGVQPDHSFEAGNFTGSAWIRCVGRVGSQQIFSHAIWPLNRGWTMNTLGDGTLNYGCYNGGTITTITASDLPPMSLGVWVHVAITCTPTLRQMYVGGWKSNVTSTGLPAASADLHTYIGRDFNGSSSFVFSGDIDDARIYRIALNDDQIQSLAGGNEPFQVTPTTRAHSTDSLLRATETKTHNTDSLLRATQIKTQNTDNLLRATLTKTHNTNTLLRATETETHNTDTALHGTLTKTHNTDTLLRATATKTHNTDSALHGTLTKTHNTDNYTVKAGTIVKSFNTDSVLHGTVTKPHNTDTLLRATQIKTHNTDTVLHGTLTKTHNADILLHGTLTKTHFTDSLLLATETKTHNTNTLLRTTIICTHKTDSSIVLGLVASRSRSQRVGTRGIAFNEG